MILQDRTVERDLDARLAAGDSAEEAVSRTLDMYVATLRQADQPAVPGADLRHQGRLPARLLAPPPARGRPSPAGPAGPGGSRGVGARPVLGRPRPPGRRRRRARRPAVPRRDHRRSLGLPMVGQVHGLIDQVQAGRRIAIDGVRPGRSTSRPPAGVSRNRRAARSSGPCRPRRARPRRASCDRPGCPASRPTSTC